MPKPKDTDVLNEEIVELTADLQRTRADFENYRKRVESEKTAARETGQSQAVIKILPIIDAISRAVKHMPEELADNAWAKGIAGVEKNLEKTLEQLKLERIDAAAGAVFNPELHEAVQFDEDAKGEKEVIAEELQTGYLFNGRPLRHAMVRVTRQ